LPEECLGLPEGLNEMDRLLDGGVFPRRSGGSSIPGLQAVVPDRDLYRLMVVKYG
jgi:hypothetical protein